MFKNAWTKCLSHVIGAMVILAAASMDVSAQPSLTVYPDGNTIKVVKDGGELFHLTPAFWGPQWAWTGVGGSFQAEGNKSVLDYDGKINKSELTYNMRIVAALNGNTLHIDYTIAPKTPGESGLMALVLKPGKMYGGQKALRFEGESSGVANLPVPQGNIGQGVKSLRFGEGSNEVKIQFQNPRDLSGFGGETRILLAESGMQNQPIQASLQVELPAEAQHFKSLDEFPKPDNWNDWFEFSADSQADGNSVISMANWLDAPAGKHGWVEMREDVLVYQDKPLKVWGLNNAFANTAPDKKIADKRADLYAKYGVNCVRLHKIIDGVGWAGIQSQDSAVEFDKEGLDRLDYYVAKLKEKGIFVKFSVMFGSPNLGPADKQYVPYMDELGQLSGRNAKRMKPGGGSMFWSPEIRDVRSLQITNLLNHTNPYTKMRYADDPAVMIVEMTNEESALFFSSMGTLMKHERFYTYVGQRFAQWLKEKYGTEEALKEAWGEGGGLNSFGETKAVDEKWDEIIIPYGNPWFWDPANLNTSQKAKKARLLDSMVFLGELQTETYQVIDKAIRDTGYKGLVMSSNWQAGSDYSHYTNLYSDAQIGMIDRHNYYSGPSMLQSPGSALLSMGMQQVADRPFSLSEWIHTPPSLLGVEGPAVLGAYGFGLNGWDISFMFENGDDGEISKSLYSQTWDVTAPTIMGVFPAVARQVLRGDVKESEVLAKRNVYVPELGEGKLGFSDSLIMDYDYKIMDSDKVPAKSLAVARSVVDFVDEPTPTPEFDLSPYKKDGSLVSSTGQLRWTPKDAYDQKGYFTMDTPGTKAVVGYARGIESRLSGMAITPRSDYAAIYVTAPGADETLNDAKSWIVTTIARAMNKDMVYFDRNILKKGKGPIMMEPVQVEIQLPSNRTNAVVHILDHDGRRTGKTIQTQGGKLLLDGAETSTVYYEIQFN
ncbi:MAG: beta-galactosidase [Candidatus Sumerlaeia bacterium]